MTKPKAQQKVLSLEELQEACKEWQKILRLQDWKIQIEIVRQWVVDPDYWAHIQTNQDYKNATIKFVDPNDINPDDVFDQRNMESDLVHELLEIHINPLITDRDMQPAKEQAINMITQAFIRLKTERRWGRSATEITADYGESLGRFYKERYGDWPETKGWTSMQKAAEHAKNKRASDIVDSMPMTYTKAKLNEMYKEMGTAAFFDWIRDEKEDQP